MKHPAHSHRTQPDFIVQPGPPLDTLERLHGDSSTFTAIRLIHVETGQIDMARAAYRLELVEPERQRMMPHNIESEQALLGAILINNDAYFRVSDFLKPEHFYEPLHSVIFEIVAGLISANKVASPITIKSFLPENLDLAGLTAIQYLARLAAEATTVINAVDYAGTIYDFATRRRLITLADSLRDAAFDPSVDSAPADLIEQAKRQLYEVSETNRFGGGFETLDEALDEAMDRAALAYQSDGKLSGLPTGLKDLDAKMGGLQPSDLIILAGRPGMGKTALATNIAFSVARAYQPATSENGGRVAASGGVVGFFSLEMSS